jgi:rhamnose utilization protein RhaD (predicted bifunctional aldolase and dehydrogenase)
MHREEAMTGQTRLLENRWDEAYAAKLDEPGKLLYRSNLLGADKRITNYGGGNTSAKVMETDPLTGEKVRVMWVKGSGSDVARSSSTVSPPSIWTSSKR